MDVFDFFKKTKDAGTGEIVLEYLLIEMQRWGKVFLHSTDKGCWNCSIDMTFASGKIEAKAASSVHKTPSAAALDCRAKLQDCIKEFNLKEPK